MHTMCVQRDREIDAIVDHDLQPDTSCKIYGTRSGSEKFADRRDLIAELDKCGTAVRETADLFQMREA